MSRQGVRGGHSVATGMVRQVPPALASRSCQTSQQADDVAAEVQRILGQW
jgi:hypothetical protein